MPIVIIISIAITFAVALITLGWFFKDGEDATREFEEYTSWRMTPGGFKFSLWLGVSGGAGMISYLLLQQAWRWVALHFG